MLKAEYARYRLNFKEPARTSRQTMTDKLTYFIRITDDEKPGIYGIGECALFEGLSCDDRADYEEVLQATCRDINFLDAEEMRKWPSIVFGVETALMDLRNGGRRQPFPSPWSEGLSDITINGLVWMGNINEMRRRIDEKLDAGFRCLKFKIGGEDFVQEKELLESVRKRYSPDTLEIRLDANGAFTPENALERLSALAPLHIHSIEQPLKAGQWNAMAFISKESPIPIALDEELIGINDAESKFKMLSAIRPRYIIIKPSLCGGFSGASEWISIAELLNTGWWATSALESNIGLNAIAQWVSTLDTTLPQGLGTGMLYTNNIASPIVQQRDKLEYAPQMAWQIPDFEWKS